MAEDLGPSTVEATVQNELQQYLNEKGVNTLFIKIVENLLLAKPDNPVGFIVEYLLKSFPEETAEFVRRKDAKSSPEAAIELEEEKKSQDSGYTDTEDDEEEDDDVGEEIAPLTNFKCKQPGGRSRRQSVSAGVLSTKSIESAKVVFPKSEEEAMKLKEIIGGSLLCSHLDGKEKDLVVDAMEKYEVADDVEIITQGDLVAEHYYVLEKGSACVLKDGINVLEYGPGSDFGELALMYNAPRAATVKSTSPCTLWRLDQNSFKLVVMGAAIRKRERFKKYLSDVKILSTMKESEIDVLADALKEKAVNAGEVIVKEGDSGDEFFIIAEGLVDVQKEGEVIGEMGEGKYFGEIALLTPKPRQATIIAKSEQVKLLCIGIKAFQRVLGNLEEILKRNIESYTQYVAGVQG